MVNLKYYTTKLILFLLLFINFLTITSYAFPYDDDTISVMREEIIELYNDNTTDELMINEFQPIIQSIFFKRNQSILSEDSEGLKSFYDLNKKVGLWAYESEIRKIKYFSNWSEKQASKFTKIKSTIKVKKAREREKDLFGVICYVSTEFTYVYLDDLQTENTFKFGTYHYLNLKKDNDNYIITKEWYTDPLADSLDLESLKSTEIKSYITNHKKTSYSPDERTQKAIDYAHRYCGISNEEDYLFKYNPKYKDFNPEGGDCANFASQILHEGGGFRKNEIWSYSSGSATKAWVNAQGFKNYMVNSGRASYIGKGTYQQTYKAAFELRPGDIVAYEKKGRITHVSTVTALDSKGYPLVTCHNTDRLTVPYDLGWSNSNIKFHFIDVHY